MKVYPMKKYAKPPPVPKAIAQRAAKLGVTVERNEYGDYIAKAADTGAFVDMTRTYRPKVCHAKAMLRRVTGILGRHGFHVRPNHVS